LAAADFTTALSAPLARVTPRERRMLAVLALVALLVAPVMAYSWAQEAQDRNFNARQDLEAQRQAQRAVSAGGVGGQTARQMAEIKAWSWPASTAQVGKVLAQDRIAAIAVRAGLIGAEIKASDKIEHAGPVDMARIDIEAPFTWAGLSGLLAGLADTHKGFLVEALTIDAGTKPLLKMSIKVPITPDTPTAAEPAA
jgi:hypothetical protein